MYSFKLFITIPINELMTIPYDIYFHLIFCHSNSIVMCLLTNKFIYFVKIYVILYLSYFNR